jgi:hypothetical protein
MGYSLSWLACKDKAPEAVQHQLGCIGTGEFGEYGDFGLVGGVLPNGWYLLIANRCETALIADAVVSEISLGCSAMACSIEEHVMCSHASFWSNGRRIWRVEHRAELGLSDLKIIGEPPPELLRLREAAAAEPATRLRGTLQADYFFDIPLELAKRMVSFKHDEVMPGIDVDHFEIFRLVDDGLLSRSTRPWWRFW